MMLLVIYCFLTCLPVRAFMTSNGDPDMHRNVGELITSKGYPVEEHCVKTRDGYLLSVQRIPHGRERHTRTQKNESVLLIHGVLSDGTIWVINFPGQSLGFVLSDEGYDVWLLNTRGSTYSKKHINFTPMDDEFWDFSIDEIALYDLPATIDYILNITGRKDLSLIGHSQGATIAFAMLSDLPDYTDKLKFIIALAPAVFISQMTSPAKLAFLFAEKISFLISNGEIKAGNQFSNTVKDLRSHEEELLENVFFLLNGQDDEKRNKTRFGVYLAQYRTSTSRRCAIHYGQLISSKKFRKYDYGRRGNIEHYNLEEPPEYDLSTIRARVALFWSANDDMVTAKDIDLLRKQLSSLVYDYCVPYPYNHCDFVYALNANQFVYEPIIKLFNKYLNPCNIVN